MSSIDNSASLSIGPLLVLTTVPVGAGALGRGPLGPLVAGRPPTRDGSLSIDRARPSTTVLQPATMSTAVTQANAARIPVITARARRPRRSFRTRLLIDQPRPDRPDSKPRNTILEGSADVMARTTPPPTTNVGITVKGPAPTPSTILDPFASSSPWQPALD